MNKIQIDAELIEGFQAVYLKSQFDGEMDTPEFHREMWADCCKPAKLVAFAAPRGHAKSTSITHTLTLAVMMFRVHDFGMIVSDTETQAIKFLSGIRNELSENAALKKDFGIKGFIKDAETEVIVEFTDGMQFCLLAKGSGQKVRGVTWRNKRPNFVVCDDLENDDIVQNRESLAKFKRWFQSALLPCGSKDCVFRLVGTILHNDSLLENLLNSDHWLTKRYSAHHSFDDFSEILWPSRWTEEKLREERQRWIGDANEDGYSQEFLNQAISMASAYFKKEWLRDINKDEMFAEKLYYVGVDLAISQAARADNTAIVVVGVTPSNRIVVSQVRKGRWDAKEIIDQLIEVQEEFEPELFVIEQGAIQKSIGPFLNDAMVERNVYLTVKTVVPSKDKRLRAKTIQGRMAAGGVVWDKEQEWYPAVEMEFLQFPRGKHDDCVDALSHLGMHLAGMARPNTDEENEEEEYERDTRSVSENRSKVTGY